MCERQADIVMAGLDPAIHEDTAVTFLALDGRIKCGHDTKQLLRITLTDILEAAAHFVIPAKRSASRDRIKVRRFNLLRFGTRLRVSGMAAPAEDHHGRKLSQKGSHPHMMAAAIRWRTWQTRLTACIRRSATVEAQWA
jgi:hypothetical protein